VGGFLAAAHKRDYARAAEYLDLHSLPPGMTESQGPELARQLVIVLDRVLWIDPDLVSASPEGDQTDALPGYSYRAETRSVVVLFASQGLEGVMEVCGG